MIDTANPTSWLAIGAIGATITACWGHIKRVWNFARGFIIVDVELRGTTPNAVIAFLLQKYDPQFFLGNREVDSIVNWVRPRRRNQEVAYEHYKMMLARIAGWPMFAFYKNGYNSTPTGGVTSNKANDSYGSVHLMFLRGTIDIDQFIYEAMEYYADQNSAVNGNACQRFAIHYISGAADIFRRGQEKGGPQGDPGPAGPTGAAGLSVNASIQSVRLFGYTHEDLMPERVKTAIEDLALDEAAEDLLAYCRHWMESKDWFLEHRVPWRYGFLAYGEPGCGKTSLIRAIAQELDLPVFVFDLSSMNNAELKREWSRMLSFTPCMPLFEDFDTVFHGRENVTKTEQNPGVTFDCLLNCIDGIQKSDGVLLAITTNDLSKIDPAIGIPSEEGSEMSTRPGRVDRTIRMGKPSEAGRRKIAERILGDWPAVIDGIMREGDGDTGAQFQYRCVLLADKLFKSKWHKPSPQFEVIEGGSRAVG